MKLCGFEVGNDQPLFLIAGTCVVESEQMTLDVAGTLQEICGDLGLPFIYKSSFDKANRSSRDGFRGPGMEEGLRILSEVKKQLDLPILTDVHEDTPMDEVADVVDVLQTPAFLCRQTNFILRTAASGPGKWTTWLKKRDPQAITTSWYASVVLALVTTTSCQTCEVSP